MKSQSKQKTLVGTLAFSALLASAGTSMANLALPAISRDFDISFSVVRWVVLSYLSTITLFSLVVGLLADLKGQKRILLAGMALFSIGTLASTLSYSYWLLIFARVVQGIGAAALVVLPIAIVTDMLPRERTGRAIGLVASMSAIGTAAGPSVGGLLLAIFGWRSIFTLMTLAGCLGLYLLLRFVQPKEGLRRNRSKNADFSNPLTSVISSSLLRTQLFSNFAVSAVMISTMIVGPYYLTHALRLDPIRMGIVMSAGPVTSILSGVFAGYAVDRFGYRIVINFALIQLLIGAVAFVLLPAQFGSTGFALSAVLLSLGYQLFLSANSNDFISNVSADRRGSVAGALSLSRNLGLISGTYVMGSIFDFFAKGPSSTFAGTKTISNGFQVTFSIAAVMIAILLINQLKYQKRRTHGEGFVNQVY